MKNDIIILNLSEMQYKLFEGVGGGGLNYWNIPG